MNRDEVRSALGAEACSALDSLRSTFDAKLIYAQFSDGRSVGKKPDWFELALSAEAERGKKEPTMTEAQYFAYIKDLERAWKDYERTRARRRA